MVNPEVAPESEKDERKRKIGPKAKIFCPPVMIKIGPSKELSCKK